HLDAGTSGQNAICLCGHQFGVCWNGISEIYALECGGPHRNWLYLDNFLPGQGSGKVEPVRCA
ncbi:MAG TPA: hypothetical protein VK210_05770, partial [Terriglobia bacterium]|nr:hypothetical protein [Terriglobia bacterium]